MDEAVTVAVVAKKLLEILASSKKGRKFLGCVIGITLFLVMLPLITLTVWACFVCSITQAEFCKTDSKITAAESPVSSTAK